MFLEIDKSNRPNKDVINIEFLFFMLPYEKQLNSFSVSNECNCVHYVMTMKNQILKII